MSDATVIGRVAGIAVTSLAGTTLRTGCARVRVGRRLAEVSSVAEQNHQRQLQAYALPLGASAAIA